MNKRQCKQARKVVDRRLLHWQHRFNLDDWCIYVTWPDQPKGEETTSMRIHWEPHYRTAVFSVFPQIFTCEPDLIDQVIRHEMLHLIFAGVDDELSDLIGEEGEVWRRYRNRTEEAVDRLAITLGAWA